MSVIIFDLDRDGSRLPFAEAVLAGNRPLWHWGSLLRLGNEIYGAGHYYTQSDSRHPSDALSRLIIKAKDDPDAAQRVGELLAKLADTPWKGMDVDLITSVPPKPEETYDRFGQVRAIAAVSGTVERGDVLRQLFDDDDYKHQRADDRPGRVRERFASVALSNERVMLIDDVITSGGQAEECRCQMLAQGASRVVVLALGVTQERLPRACPECGGFLRLITTGPRGDFIGCSNFYRGCRYTEDAPSV
jgi:phosphoribosylpyrophosphate synthetase